MACGLLAIDAGPALAVTPTGILYCPGEGKVLPCPVDVENAGKCEAYAGPAPGTFTWHIGGTDYGPTSGTHYVKMDAVESLGVSVTYTYTGPGGGTLGHAAG